MLFVPQGMHVEHGWLRPAQARVALGGETLRRHEEYTIIELEPEPLPQQVGALIDDIVDFLQDPFPVRVVSAFPSPFGVGLFQLQNPVQRACLLDASPI